MSVQDVYPVVTPESAAQEPHLPVALYKLVAQMVSQDDLPALRLTSKEWHDAANAAVQRIGKGGWLTKLQLQYLPKAVHKFSGISSLDLTFLAEAAQDLLKRLLSVSRLQALTMYFTLAQLPIGLQFILQQRHLTSLTANSLEYDPEAGIRDSFLHSIACIESLVELDLHLSDSVTNAAISGFSGLTNLQSLRLPVSKHGAGVTGRSMTVFTALSKLTHLSLEGWPLKDTHVAMMTRLTELQKIDITCVNPCLPYASCLCCNSRT